MKAMGILAGPRKGCATDTMIDAVLKGLKDAGHETEKVHLYELSINPCRGCLACEKLNRCVIDDDLPPLLDRIGEAEILVFGSPTYFSNVTSVAKAFIDRGLSFFTMTKWGPKRFAPKPSKVVLITACGAPAPFSFLLGISTGAMRAMKVFFRCMNATVYTLAAPGMLELTTLPSKATLDTAYRLGKKLS